MTRAMFASGKSVRFSPNENEDRTGDVKIFAAARTHLHNCLR